jgi:hypothetical protein
MTMFQRHGDLTGYIEHLRFGEPFSAIGRYLRLFLDWVDVTLQLEASEPLCPSLSLCSNP